MADDLETMLVDARALARFLGLSRQRINQLTDDGTLRRGEGGRYPLADSVRRYAAHLRDRPTQSAADVKVREARAAEIELRTMQRAREVVPIDDAFAFADALAGRVRAGADALPAQIAGRDMGLRNHAEKCVRVYLTDIADFLDREAARLRSGKAA